MPSIRNRRAVASAAALVVAFALASCTPQPAGTGGDSCTISIGSLPDFALTGSAQGFEAVRPGAGGVTVVDVPIADVQPGAFDYVLWDALDRNDYDQPPDSMQFYVEQNQTTGTAGTVLKINVYADTPTGTYPLKVRGLAFEGTFFDDITDDLVGECFRTFDLTVRD